MANDFTVFEQTLIATAEDISSVQYGPNRIIESVYQDINPVERSPGIGHTVNVIVPSQIAMKDVSAGLGAAVDQTPDVLPIVMDQHRGNSIFVDDFSEFNSPEVIRRRFVKPLIDGAFNDVNKRLSTNITTTNYGASVGTNTGSLIPVANFLDAYTQLQEANCPMDNPDDLVLLVTPKVNGAMIADTDWSKATTTGDSIAGSIRSSGSLGRYAYGVQVKWDNDLPTTGTVGTRTFTCVLLHRWALALAIRPLSNPEQNTGVYSQTVYVKGVPIRFMIGYSQDNLGYKVSADFAFGMAKMRSEYARVFTVTEA